MKLIGLHVMCLELIKIEPSEIIKNLRFLLIQNALVYKIQICFCLCDESTSPVGVAIVQYFNFIEFLNSVKTPLHIINSRG